MTTTLAHKALVAAALTGLVATVWAFVNLVVGGSMVYFIVAALWLALPVLVLLLLSRADARDRAAQQRWPVVSPYDPARDEQRAIVKGLQPVEWHYKLK